MDEELQKVVDLTLRLRGINEDIKQLYAEIHGEGSHVEDSEDVTQALSEIRAAIMNISVWYGLELTESL